MLLWPRTPCPVCHRNRVTSNVLPAPMVAAPVVKVALVVSLVLKARHVRMPALKAVASAVLAGTVKRARVTTRHRASPPKSSSTQKQHLCKPLWLKTALRVAVISQSHRLRHLPWYLQHPPITVWTAKQPAPRQQSAMPSMTTP